jgi:hypothetical protein
MEVTDFDAERPRLTAIAAGVLGSEADADDVLQETRLRLLRTDDIDDLPAWLTTVVTRLCLDQLRKRRIRSVVEAPADPAPVDAQADALLAEKTGIAMQGRPRRPGAGREGCVRPARCLRLSVPRDQRGHGALGYRRPPASKQSPAQGAGRARAGRRAGRAGKPPRRGRVPHCGSRWGFSDSLVVRARVKS